MLKNFGKRVTFLMTLAVMALCMGMPAFARDIPLTGDGSGMMMPIMGGLLAVSAILIVVFVVLSAKKRK